MLRTRVALPSCMRALLLVTLLLLVPVSIGRADAALITDGVHSYLVKDGVLLGSRPGVFVGTSRGLIELSIGARTLPLYDCEVEPPTLLSETVEAPTLVAIEEDGTTTELIAVSASGAREHESNITIEAILGSYVFASQYVWEDGCGAHGNSSRSLIVYDLEARASVDLASDPRLTAWIASLRGAAHDAYAAWGEFPIDDVREDLIAFIPRLGGAAIPRVDAVFAAFTCYACSDVGGDTMSDWGSYYSAAHVDAALPAFLRPAARATARARRVYASDPSATSMTGASALTEEVALRARASFTS